MVNAASLQEFAAQEKKKKKDAVAILVLLKYFPCIMQRPQSTVCLFEKYHFLFVSL